METSGENLHLLYRELGDLRGDFRNYNLYRFILKRVRGKRVLDIGCGAGHFLSVAKGAGFETTGIEENKDLIAFSHELYKDSLGIQEGSAEGIASVKGTYDAIVMIDVLEHLEKDEDVLRLLKSKLNNGGRLIVLVPSYQMLYGKRDKSIGHYRRYTRSSLNRKMKNSGYKVVESRYWNMLGVGPYFVAEKIMKKEFVLGFRGKKKKGLLGTAFKKGLFEWFRVVENPLNLGFGLSVLCVGEYHSGS